MKRIKNVKKYAKQFLDSVEIKDAQQAIEHLNVISTLIEKGGDFKNLMVGPAFSESEKQKTIAFISQKVGISDKTVKYIQYLSDTKAIIAMPNIVKSIVVLYLEMKKRTEAVVTTPTQISKSFEAKLIKVLEQITGKNIDLEFVIDPSLLGGIHIKVGSAMYDSSIKGQIGSLKDKLLKG